MRICAQTLFNDPETRGTFSSQEKAYYSSAVEHYQKSLVALGERKSCPEVWDRVTWELSGTYYTMGTLIQDFVSVKEFEAETVRCFASVYKLLTKCVCTFCSKWSEQVWNRLLTTCNNLDGTIRLVTRLFQQD